MGQFRPPYIRAFVVNESKTLPQQWSGPLLVLHKLVFLRKRLLRITASQKVHVLGFLPTPLLYAQFKRGMFSSDSE